MWTTWPLLHRILVSFAPETMGGFEIYVLISILGLVHWSVRQSVGRLVVWSELGKFPLGNEDSCLPSLQFICIMVTLDCNLGLGMNQETSTNEFMITVISW